LIRRKEQAMCSVGDSSGIEGQESRQEEQVRRGKGEKKCVWVVEGRDTDRQRMSMALLKQRKTSGDERILEGLSGVGEQGSNRQENGSI